jgi:ring-1,2-phenylacetyl-CoA epoxidase subunit PaaE
VAVEFHRLPVSVRPETGESVSVGFAVPAELRQTFRHVPGQHVVLRALLGGDDVRRSYSICSVPGGAVLRVGIKRIPGGVFSAYATTELADGDTLEVMAPIGEFCHRPDPGVAARYVALAAGSGITPVLSILTSILEIEPSSHCTLVYGNRYVRSIMFLEELEALKDRFPERFQLIHVLSREPHEIPLFEGRIDGDKLRLLAKTLIRVDDVDTWFCCGPLDMVETARATLADLGVDDHRIRYELFFDQRIEPVPEPPPSGEGLVTLTVTLDGRTSTVPVERGGPPLLDYARTVRPEAPFACKGGMCATCKAKVVTGEVTMAKNYALTDAEIAAGYILSCQSHPAGGDLAITYDLHGAPPPA